MKNTPRSAAIKFSIYGQLVNLDRWRLIRSTRQICRDPDSQQVLLDFERVLLEQSLYFWQVFDMLMVALAHYNRATRDTRLVPPEQRDQLPEILRVVTLFLEASPKLNLQYTGLFVHIASTGHGLAQDRATRSRTYITSEQFRTETANAIFASARNKSWWDWDPHWNDTAMGLVTKLEDIACQVGDPHRFRIAAAFLGARPNLHDKYTDLVVHLTRAGERLRTSGEDPGVTPEQFRAEAVHAIADLGMWRWAEWHPDFNDRAMRTLGYLENIACQVSDLEQFKKVYQEIAATTGLEAASTLLTTLQSVDELSSYHVRISAQLERWKWTYEYVFGQVRSESELDRVLGFLETLSEHPQMVKCIHYTQTHYPQLRLAPSKSVIETCQNLAQNKQDDDARMDSVLAMYVRNIVRQEIQNILWKDVVARNIRWSFDTFTDHVPSTEQANVWTLDNARARRYWNWQKSLKLEAERFLSALLPRLSVQFQALSYNEFRAILALLPDYFRVQPFAQTVQVPVGWRQKVITQEGYNKWRGFYTDEVEVAYPTAFAPHTFTFERPDIEQAIALLDDKDRLGQAIQALKNLGTRNGP